MRTTKFTGVMLVITLFFSSCYLFRAIHFRKFELKDLHKLKAVNILHSTHPFQFVQATQSYPAITTYLDTSLANTFTYSFLVIKNDSIIYEKYFDQITQTTQLPSFSVAKSFVSTLVGIAYEEGAIRSLNDSITRYLPELLKADKRFGQITIQHVLDMRSGIKSSENYDNPASDVLKLGFTPNLAPHMRHLKIEKPPGKFEYKSVNTQVLAMILQRATGVPIQQYLQTKLWEPLGMESDATWNIDNDKNKQARAFCCLNAATRDYAKLGRLFLNKGNWNGKQIISQNWVKSSTDPDSMLQYEGYRNQWWSSYIYKTFTDSMECVKFIQQQPACYPDVYAHRKKDKPTVYYAYFYIPQFNAEGILGQYIYVNTAQNIVIVRTGHYWQHKTIRTPESLFYGVCTKLK